jgi:hypothetical protein
MRKGQGAMEYLMTYGWALLVIIIVGAALFALGILNPATYQQKRCNGFQYVTYMDQSAVDATGTYTLHIRNGVNDINITQISVTGTNTTAVGDAAVDTRLVLDGDEGNYNGNSTTWLSQGKEVVITASGLGMPAGSYDDLGVTITYNVKNGITGNTDTATCVGTSV